LTKQTAGCTLKKVVDVARYPAWAPTAT